MQNNKLSKWDNVRIWWILRKLNIQRFFLDKLPREIAWRLPWRIRMWVVVKAGAEAAGNDKSPDQVTYLDMYLTTDRRNQPDRVRG